MNPLRRLYRAFWTLVSGPIHAYYLKLMKESCLCRIDGVAVCDMSIEQHLQADFLKLTSEAMALIKSTDARRYRRVCLNLSYIVNSPLITPGNYDHKDRICNVDYAKHFRSEDQQWNLRMFACLLIHEATHGVITTRGILYQNDDRERIERLCHREEYRFALRIDHGYANASIGSFDPNRWKPYWEGSRQDRAAASWKRLREGLMAFFKQTK